MVLIVVMVVVVALSLAACTFAEWMFTERQAAYLSGRQAKALALAESGVEAARQVLSSDPQTAIDLGGWYDNPDLFRGILVLDGDLPRDRGRFTVLSPIMDQGQYAGTRYGLENESAKLNVNALLLLEKRSSGAGKAFLMVLPGMTDEIADAILDWLDDDDEPRASGAESEYYSTLDPPYAPKNGLLQSLDELLMVRGVTPELLFGVDRNRNGFADDTEPDPSTLASVDSALASQDRGWSAYLTLYSLEANLQTDGQPKINVNQDDLQKLNDELQQVLDPAWVKYLIAYRQQVQSSSSSSSSSSGSSSQQQDSQSQQDGEASSSDRDGQQGDEQEQSKKSSSTQDQAVDTGSRELDLTQPGKTKLTSVLDVIDSKIQVKYKGQTKAIDVENPFQSGNVREYLTKLMDVLAMDDNKVIAGRININEAPAALLAAIPDMPADAVDSILSHRQSDITGSDFELRQATWLLNEGIVNLQQMKKLLPMITGGGSVYRAQVVGSFDRDGPAARLEVVFDTTKSPVRVVSWKELTQLGRGYPLESLGIDPNAE